MSRSTVAAGDSAPPAAIKRQRFGDVTYPGLMFVVIALSALVFAVLLYMTSYMNFFWDEWDFISYDRSWTVDVFLLPHNEHWSTIPILVWKVLFVVAGIRSHIPYEAAVLAAHVATVLLMFTLVRRRSGDLPAFAAAVTFLVLGTGGTDIVWAFQIGFVGSVAFGLLAMLLLDGDPPFPGRLLPASAALLASLMCSGTGLAFLVAVAVELAVDRRRRRFLLSLVIPIGAYGEWFLAYGAGLPGSPGAPCTSCIPTGLAADFQQVRFGLNYIESLAGFVAWGLQATAAGLVGFPALAGILLPVLAGLVAFHWYRQRKVAPWQIGMTAGLLAQFVVTGLVRAQNGPAAAGHPRYVYVGVAFLLPLVADATRELPWGRLWRPLLTALFGLCLIGNTVQLRDRALIDTVPGIQPVATQVDLMQIEDAELQTVEVFRGAPDMNLNRGLDDAVMPQLNAGPYLEAVSQLGSPVPQASLATLRQLPGQAVDQVMVNLFGGAVAVNPDKSRPTQGLPCRSVDSTDGATLDFMAPEGQSFMLESSKGGDGFLFLGFMNPPTSEPLQHVQLLPATPEWVYMPNTGKPIIWRLRIKTTPMGTLQVCGATNFQAAQTPNDLDRGLAADGTLDSGWSVVSDPATPSGRAAKGASGTHTAYRGDLFGDPFIPFAGAYDVWYRVRVKSSSGTDDEIVLGLWDDQARNWIASTTYKPDQVGTSYSWIKVASAIHPAAGHSVHFLAAITLRVGTDWYVDEAVLVPTGSSPPA